MGSFVAQEIALLAPERVARLVLVGAMANPRKINGMSEFEQVIDGLEDPVPAEFVYEFQTSTIYQPLPANILDRVIVESLKLPPRIWKATMAGMLAADYSPRLNQIRMPALVLWGDQDSLFGRSGQDELVAGLGAATLKVYPETGHALHWEQPEQFARDIANFISKS